jgi:hypothetical protein
MQMNLMRGKAILESENCKDIIRFYETEGDVLFSKEVGDAQWNAVEKKRLMRCTVMAGNFSLWEKGIKERWEPATTEIQSSLLGYLRLSNRKTYEKLKRSLVGTGANLDKLAHQRENISDSLLLRVPDFWFLLAGHHVYLWQLAQNKVGDSGSEDSKLDSCLERSQALDSGNVRSVEKVLLSYSFAWWTDHFLLTKEKIPKKGSEGKEPEGNSDKNSKKSHAEISRCEQLLVDKMLILVRGGKFPSLVSQLWVPFLKKLGLKEGGEEWIEYAYYLEKTLGPENKETVEVFQKIFKESESVMPKETAGIWLEKHAKAGQPNW